MRPGDAFLWDGHLWIVLSDPAANDTRVFVANLTSTPFDPTCVLEPGDHPFITHRSYVFYKEARCPSLVRLAALRQSGGMTPQPPFRPEVFNRIRAGALESPHSSMDMKISLQTQ